jgi:hypothetical protein
MEERSRRGVGKERTGSVLNSDPGAQGGVQVVVEGVSEWEGCEDRVGEGMSRGIEVAGGQCPITEAHAGFVLVVMLTGRLRHGEGEGCRAEAVGMSQGRGQTANIGADKNSAQEVGDEKAVHQTHFPWISELCVQFSR